MKLFFKNEKLDLILKIFLGTNFLFALISSINSYNLYDFILLILLQNLFLLGLIIALIFMVAWLPPLWIFLWWFIKDKYK